MEKTHYEEELEAAIENVGKAQRRGIKVLIGSDFGFSWCPHGTYGRELTHLVKLVGYKPMDALVAATKLGAQAMRMQDKIGSLEPGKLADLIVVDGDPREFGQKYELRVAMNGPAGSKIVLSVCLIEPADPRPRLITCFVE